MLFKYQRFNLIFFWQKPGDQIAFIGKSGSGKSTIIKLLERFYDISQGSITFDGIELKDLNMISLRKNIGYVA